MYDCVNVTEMQVIVYIVTLLLYDNDYTYSLMNDHNTFVLAAVAITGRLHFNYS